MQNVLWMDGYPLDCYDYQSTCGAKNVKELKNDILLTGKITTFLEPFPNDVVGLGKKSVDHYFFVFPEVLLSSRLYHQHSLLRVICQKHVNNFAIQGGEKLFYGMFRFTAWRLCRKDQDSVIL